MKRTIGILLIVAGIIAGAFALTRHEDEKTLLDIGNVEIKNENKAAGKNTQMYYVIAIAGILGGAFLTMSNRR